MNRLPDIYYHMVINSNKCKECSVLGLKIIRDVDAEVKEEEIRSHSKEKEEEK